MTEPVARWRRWLRGDVLLALVAIGAGTGGAVLTGRHVEARIAAAETSMASRYETRPVVVAAADLVSGSSLLRDNLAVRRIPRDYLPPDAVSAEAAGELIGRRLASDVARGMPVARGALAHDEAERLSLVLAPTQRALTLSVDDLNSQAGAVVAGDLVDLYYGRREDGEALLIPLLQGVQVLAAGSSFTSGQASPDYSTLTLRVSSDDAPRVLLAQQAGDVTVLLRGQGDDARLAPRLLNSRDLLRAPTTRAAAPGIEVLTGGQGGGAPARSFLRAGSAARSDAS